LPNPAGLWQGQLPVFAWGVYGSTLKRAIAALKYENQPQLARPLGRWLARSWLSSQLINTGLIVVPIPLYTSRQEERGYNQAALLAKSFCDTTGLRLQRMGLQRIRPTEAQFRISADAREKNLAMAFGLGSEFRSNRPNSPVLLLDDVYTTGATARAAAQILRQSGIQVYGLATISISRKS